MLSTSGSKGAKHVTSEAENKTFDDVCNAFKCSAVLEAGVELPLAPGFVHNNSWA